VTALHDNVLANREHEEPRAEWIHKAILADAKTIA
jgi:hypothetical protein